jgi:hypothetical protein
VRTNVTRNESIFGQRFTLSHYTAQTNLLATLQDRSIVHRPQDRDVQWRVIANLRRDLEKTVAKEPRAAT